MKRFYLFRKSSGIILLILTFSLIYSQISTGYELRINWKKEFFEIEKKVQVTIPDSRYPDDPFILVTLQEAVSAIREGNGGIGACLVKESSGEVVERGHNRQFIPYFRSDLHAEMDLLTRYEERIKAPRPQDPNVADPRRIDGLILYTSVEPCPMCLTRIINIGLKKIYYAAPDPTGGMAKKITNLPVFWQNLAAKQIYKPANCSPELKELAQKLFRPMSSN